MTGTSTPVSRAATYAVAPDYDSRSDQDLAIGKLCSAQSCNLVDFLPFRCDHCGESFCQHHYMPTEHYCEKWDRNAADRHPIECPLCKIPITIPSGQDPNNRIGKHLDEECEVTTGKAKKPSTPICARARCTKLLWQPIKCEKCHKEFCATHRYPDTHACEPVSRAISKTNTWLSRAQKSKVRTTAAAAIARHNTGSIGSSSIPQAATKPPVLSGVNPLLSAPPSSATGVAAPSDTLATKLNAYFSPQERRAKAERRSQIRAMEERLQKGLLSEEEKVQLQALREGTKKEASDCVIA